jgi:hypothetical protein
MRRCGSLAQIPQQPTGAVCEGTGTQSIKGGQGCAGLNSRLRTIMRAVSIAAQIADSHFSPAKSGFGFLIRQAECFETIGGLAQTG